MSGIRGYQELWPEHMCPCVSVCQFPLLPGQSRDVHRHLSSLFLSCLIFPAPSGHKLVVSKLCIVDLFVVPFYLVVDTCRGEILRGKAFTAANETFTP